LAALVAAALARRWLVAAGGPRRLVPALATLAAIALFASALLDREAASGPAGLETAARQSYAEAWQELETAASSVAAAIEPVALEESERDARFGRLRAALEPLGAAAPTVMVFDRFGDLDCWWGGGLAPDVPAAQRTADGFGIYRSALSTTAFVGRSMSVAGATWHVLAARSFPSDGPPPSRAVDRGRWSVARWAILAAQGEGLPELALDSPVVAVPSSAAAVLSAAARLLLAVLLAALSLVAFLQRADRQASAAAGWLFWLLLGFAGAVAVFAAGASWTAAATLLGAVGLIAVAWSPAVRPSVARGPRWLWVTGAAVLTPALSVAIERWNWPSLTGELRLLDGERAAFRLAAAALLFAGWRLASLCCAEIQRRRTDLAWLVAVVAAGAAAIAVDLPIAARVSMAIAGGALAMAIPRRRRRGWSEDVGLAAIALWLAASASAVAERQAEVRTDIDVLPSALAPSPEALAAVGQKVERELDAALAAGSPITWRPVDEISDLAFALWRRSSLARPDLLSAMTVVAPDGALSTFSSGLPIDAIGNLDSRPTRWSGRVPEAWLARRIGGERARRDAHGAAWVTRWLAVPRPGFPAAEAGSGAPGKLGEARRSGETGGVFTARDPELRIALYDGGGRLIDSPWIEGTPTLDLEWTRAPAFSRRVTSPDGEARVAAVAGGGLVAVGFLPATSPAEAVERAASFVAGATIPTLVLAVPVLLLALPRRVIRDQLSHAWFSYSRRLVMLFTLLLLVPVVLGSTWVAHSYAQRLQREQGAAALDSLRSAQRILGEYVLSLEPGFGVGTALDDRLLEWLARVVRSEVHLYWGSELYASSKRDLFEAGVLPTRLSGEIWERIHGRHERVVRRLLRTPGGEYVEIYAPLEIPGSEPDATKLVLALPRLAQQEELALEIARVRRRAFLGASALAVLLAVAGALLARRFARPIEEIVRGTSRIAEGAPSLGYTPDELELETLAAAIDRMAARIAEARARLLVEKELVERIVENVTAAVVGLDRDGRVVFANRLARTLLGAAPGEAFRGRLHGASLAAAARAFDRAAGTGEPVAARLEIAGDPRDWTLVRAPLGGPGEPSELVVVEDVTDVVKAQRLDAWAAMARIIAHEVKNPLTPIRLSTEHLREAWQRDREHFATVFERCTTNILRQVEELRLTASEFSLYSEIPRIERREDDLAAVVGEVAEAYRAAPPAGVTIDLVRPAEPMPASFDRRLLGRAVRNLIENAMRAAGSPGRVEIELDSSSDSHLVRVADSGPGVPAEQLSRIAEPYFSTQAGGTGLGLPIAKRIAEEHGGALTLRNRPSGGFEATITIPKA